MSTTPQTSQQQGHQHNQPQGPSTAPPQPFGQQSGQQPGLGRPGIGQLPFEQQPFGQQPLGQQQTPAQMLPQQMSQQVPPHLRQQLQQMGQQQPFQQLLQQLAGQQQGQLSGQMPGLQQGQAPGQEQGQGQGQPIVPMSAVASQTLVSGTVQHFWDVVTPLPGQPPVLYLFIDNAWRPLVNPDQVTHDGVQRAFAHGQQVMGVYDGNSGTVQAVIVNQ